MTANFDLSGANVNIAASRLEDDNTDQTVNSYAANFTYGNFGAGVILSEEDNATGPDPDKTTTYIAYSVPLFGIKEAVVTFAGSYSSASDVVDDETTAARVRFNYTFKTAFNSA